MLQAFYKEIYVASLFKDDMFNDDFKDDMILKPFPISLLENGIIINIIIGK